MTTAAKTVWEIVNPSDYVTMLCDDFEVAAVATIILGEGRFGANEVGGGRAVPALIFGLHWDSWSTHQFGVGLETLISRTLTSRRADLVDALESCAYGNRGVLADAMAAIDSPEKRDAFLRSWNDRHRSSMSDIVTRAHEWAHAHREPK